MLLDEQFSELCRQEHTRYTRTLYVGIQRIDVKTGLLGDDVHSRACEERGEEGIEMGIETETGMHTQYVL